MLQTHRDQPGKLQVFLVGDYSSAAEFFVTVAVFAFLYALGALGVYLFLDSKYRENNKGPVIVSGGAVGRWGASCAWAKALADVKEATAPAGVLAELPGCRRPGARCRGLRAPLTSGLNTSVVRPYSAPMRPGGGPAAAACAPRSPPASTPPW
uniref:Uncharacterized protein n=1 Tax=Apteryx owenii TaxID=8824 RepID=A0A8B9PTU9_APTOW